MTDDRDTPESTGEPAGYLRQVYGIDDPEEIREYYDTWAQTYDDELSANGYATPAVVARALAQRAADLTAPVLDYGCGTGMSGSALIDAGFSTVDGADPSHEMLEVARSKGIYRELVELDLTADRPPFDPRSYAVVTAIGVIGPGAAPLSLLDLVVEIVADGGLFGVSFNDHALEDPAYREKVAELTSPSGSFSVEFDERGAHLPGIDVQSTVIVLRRRT